jgi:hypothetical protein
LAPRISATAGSKTPIGVPVNDPDRVRPLRIGFAMYFRSIMHPAKLERFNISTYLDEPADRRLQVTTAAGQARSGGRRVCVVGSFGSSFADCRHQR